MSGLEGRTTGNPMRAEQIARVVHEANRALQIEQADPTIPVSRPWDETDAETQGSAVDGVRAVLEGAGPEQSHENWVRYKREHGWTLGPVKDEALKQHPLLVPYGELPESQRLKDSLFGAIVWALACTAEPLRIILAQGEHLLTASNVNAMGTSRALRRSSPRGL